MISGDIIKYHSITKKWGNNKECRKFAQRIDNWLAQFEEDEKPLMLDLLRHFTYYSERRLKKEIVKLFDEFTRVYNGEFILSPIQKEVGVVNNMVDELLDGYEITSLALPFGISSKEHKEYIAKGSYDEKTYDNKIILLVGAEPALSPNNEKVNLLKLPRVRARGGNKAVECDLYYWLEKMEQNPNLKYERIK